MGIANKQLDGDSFTLQLQARLLEDQYKLIQALRLEVAVLKKKLEEKA